MNDDFNNVPTQVRYWFLPMIFGIIFIIVGIWVFLTPEESYIALSVLFALTFLISGSLGIMYAISNRNVIKGWGWSLAAGIAELLIGILLTSRSDITVLVLALFVGFAVLFRSILAIIWSFELKNLQVQNWGSLLILGILGLVLAFIMLWNPLFAGLTIVIYTALAFIVIGGFQMYLSYKMKKLND